MNEDKQKLLLTVGFLYGLAATTQDEDLKDRIYDFGRTMQFDKIVEAPKKEGKKNEKKRTAE